MSDVKFQIKNSLNTFSFEYKEFVPLFDFDHYGLLPRSTCKFTLKKFLALDVHICKRIFY